MAFPMSELPWSSCSPTRTPWIPPPRLLSLLPRHCHNVTKWHRKQNRCGYAKKQPHCGQRLHVGHECLSLDLGSSAPRSGGG